MKDYKRQLSILNQQYELLGFTSEPVPVVPAVVLKGTMAVFILSSKKETKRFFPNIPRPLTTLKGLHLSLYSLSSGEGKIDYDGDPLRQSSSKTHRACAPAG